MDNQFEHTPENNDSEHNTYSDPNQDYSKQDSSYQNGSYQNGPYQNGSYQNQSYQNDAYQNHSYQNGYGNGNQQYQQPNYGYNSNYNRYPNYNNQNPGMDTSPMTMGDWVLTLLALMIPCAGIVLYFVWAFGSHGNINRRNFCRAQLAILGVVLILYLILILIFGVTFAGATSVY